MSTRNPAVRRLRLNLVNDVCEHCSKRFDQDPVSTIKNHEVNCKERPNSVFVRLRRKVAKREETAERVADGEAVERVAVGEAAEAVLGEADDDVSDGEADEDVADGALGKKNKGKKHKGKKNKGKKKKNKGKKNKSKK